MLRPSWLPELVSDFEPLLPSIDSVPLPGVLPFILLQQWSTIIESIQTLGKKDGQGLTGKLCYCPAVVTGADFKNGVAAAVPGWENVRLLAPHAELRLLVCGQSTIIDSHRLRCSNVPATLGFESVIPSMTHKECSHPCMGSCLRTVNARRFNFAVWHTSLQTLLFWMVSRSKFKFKLWDFESQICAVQLPGGGSEGTAGAGSAPAVPVQPQPLRAHTRPSANKRNSHSLLSALGFQRARHRCPGRTSPRCGTSTFTM